jgi:hypothetical protein
MDTSISCLAKLASYTCLIAVTGLHSGFYNRSLEDVGTISGRGIHLEIL